MRRRGRSRRYGVGVEVFYTGDQALHESPYRRSSEPYVMYGVIAEWRVGKARLFFNAENLGDVRQTDFDPLVVPSRRPDGRWQQQARWWRPPTSSSSPDVVDWGPPSRPSPMLTLTALRVLRAGGR